MIVRFNPSQVQFTLKPVWGCPGKPPPVSIPHRFNSHLKKSQKDSQTLAKFNNALKALLYSLVETFMGYFDIFTVAAGRRDNITIELDEKDIKKPRLDKIAPDLAKNVPFSSQ